MDKPESPWGMIATGVLAGALGGFLLAVGGSEGMVWFTLAGAVVAAVALILVGAGTIAVGVEWGLARHSWRQRG